MWSAFLVVHKAKKFCNIDQINMDELARNDLLREKQNIREKIKLKRRRNIKTGKA